MSSKAKFDKAFIGIDGFNAETGFTGRNSMRTEVVNTVLAKNSENIIITDSSKFGQIQPYAFTHKAKITRVITDGYLTPHYEQLLVKQKIIVNKVMD